jgi:hypothetical protein
MTKELEFQAGERDFSLFLQHPHWLWDHLSTYSFDMGGCFLG